MKGGFYPDYYEHNSLLERAFDMDSPWSVRVELFSESIASGISGPVTGPTTRF